MNTEWKPIESAPQTGRTLLLGYWNSHGKWRTVRGRWMSLEYIAEHWEDPDEAEAGWFETAVEADDAPNCWAVSPSHWQPMPAPPCPICNDQGAVGNILTAEPCPDCSPPAPTSHPVPTGATGEDGEKRVHKNGFGSVSFTLSDGSTVSCEWAPSQWEVSIPAKRLDRDVAFKELLQEIGCLRASAPAAGNALTDAARDVLAERQRQIRAEGWTPEHDDAYADEQLARAAVCYALPQGNYEIPEPPEFWPWDAVWWKPGDRRRELIKAGALVLAEIERLDRAAIAQQSQRKEA